MTALVASGTNAGVATSPCGSRRVPARPRDAGSRWWISKPGTGRGAYAPRPSRPASGREPRPQEAGVASWPSMACWPPWAIEMRRGFRSSGLGMRISSTPRSNFAATASASTPLGSVSEREKAPNERSTRWKPSSRCSCSALRSPETVSVPSSSSISMSSSDMPGRSARRTKWSPDSTRSMAGTQRRSTAPELPPPAGASKTVLKRRFISLCSELSSRSGSQRTMVIGFLPSGTGRCGQLGGSIRSQSLSIKFCTAFGLRPGARKHPLPELRELAHLVLGEMPEEAAADDLDVGRAGVLDHRAAPIGEHRVAAAPVLGAGRARDDALALEPVDEPRHARAAEQDVLGQLRHPQPPARRLAQRAEDLVGGQRQAVAGLELGVELAGEGGVHADEPAPRAELGFPELRLVRWRAHVHRREGYSVVELPLEDRERGALRILDQDEATTVGDVHRPHERLAARLPRRLLRRLDVGDGEVRE